ncbi:MAG: hypothetical protein HN509_15395 [Halobacteriovoraceae bacterium]|jgi:hypothetical protein|nr:hypothetical protein [Halobacteriovoraceae bacterium]MBT5093478.1 hypothetical protein [Halobacteriovoraceae bacterium]
MTKTLRLIIIAFFSWASVSAFASAELDQTAQDHINSRFQNADLRLTEVKSSLTGRHYHYQSFLNDREVDGNEFVVSLKYDGSLLKTYDRFTKVSSDEKSNTAALQLITKEGALDTAWEYLRVHGELIDLPQVELNYRRIQGQLRLVYKAQVNVSKPWGYWELIIDATTGKVTNVRNTSITRRKMEWKMDLSAYKGKLSSRLEESQKLVSKILDQNLKSTSDFVSGSATVFDPNPVTTLMNGELRDNTRGPVFDAAYFGVQLQQLTESNGTYTLSGPFVKLADFESPRTAPSTSRDGSWNFKRGNTAFNDAMTFYHIDASQRYIQSLGFTGDRGFLNFPVEVDANGVNGADNSHFIPSSNRLAFGHGCVDDNEDSDVILHEYGHAIQHNIISNWRGGDTGAMGEGFGDYWAASFSASRKNGLAFKPNWVFKWDGHNNCWPGRKLNALNMRYDHSRRYSAHSRVSGGISDELWSTPLFQAFLELLDKGYKRSDMDKIVLEGHFGLGSGPKMRDLARSTVTAASNLFPDGPHAEVYRAHFKRHGIIE